MSFRKRMHHSLKRLPHISAFLLLVICGTTSTALAEEDAVCLSVPKFHCELPSYRNTGDGSNQVIQLRRIERVYRLCVTTFKTQLRQQQIVLHEMRTTAQDDDARTNIDRALLLLETILALDFESYSLGPDPDISDFFVRRGTNR